MNWLKIDTLRNYTIIAVSPNSFILLPWEIQVQSDYDFPTSQWVIYYRWNGSDVEPNDEKTILTYYADEDTLSGLDLAPVIENVTGGDFQPNDTKDITITGDYFSPYSVIQISGSENVMNKSYFDNSKQIRANITAGTIEGLFNIDVINDQLDSGAGGDNTISVKSKTTVDLRTTPLGSMGIEATSDTTVLQDASRGIYFNTGTTSWNRGVKLTAWPWMRNENITYEVIFTRTASVTFMLGIADASLIVNPISSAYYKMEIGMYNANNSFSYCYGGGDVANWNQNIGATITLNDNLFFKLKLANSGGSGATCSIWEVDPDDWDDETLLHSWVSNCPADAEELVPFILPQSPAQTYFITGFRY